MKPTKPIQLLIAILFSLNSFAQDSTFSFQHYTWSDKLPVYSPEEKDKLYPTIVVSQKRYIEYIYNEKKQELEEYFISHYVKYINEDKSVEENNKLYVSASKGQSTQGIRTRVILNGKVVSEADEDDFIKVEEDGQKYNMIAIKGLQVGAMVETVIKMKLDMDLYGDEYFQGTSPIKEAEFLLVAPSRLEFRCKAYNGMTSIKDTVFGERRFSWSTHKNIPAMPTDEIYAHEKANSLRVEYTFFRNRETGKQYSKWAEMGRTFFDRMSEGYEANEKELEKVIRKLGVDKMKKDEEKVFAIENFLKSNLSIQKGNYDNVTAKDILAKKYCAPYYMNLMMIQMLRKAGVNTEIVVTTDRADKRFDQEFDSWSYLNNVIVFIPSINMFVDPQSIGFRLGKIDWGYLGQAGLFIKSVSIGDVVSASASVKFIPVNNPAESKDMETYHVTFDPAIEKVKLDYKREMNGYTEGGLKAAYYYKEAKEKNDLIKEFVQGLAKDADVTNIVVENANLSSLTEVKAPLIIKANVSSRHYLETAGDNAYLFKVGELIGQQSEMYNERPRVNPMDITNAHSYNRSITIQIPAGYTFKGIEKLNFAHEFKNEKGNPSFGFISKARIEGQTIIIEVTEYYNDLSYPLSQYENFKRVINDAADFNKISLLLEKK